MLFPFFSQFVFLIECFFFLKYFSFCSFLSSLQTFCVLYVFFTLLICCFVSFYFIYLELIFIFRIIENDVKYDIVWTSFDGTGEDYVNYYTTLRGIRAVKKQGGFKSANPRRIIYDGKRTW